MFVKGPEFRWGLKSKAGLKSSHKLKYKTGLKSSFRLKTRTGL